MRSILSPAGRAVLDAYAASNILLGFDFDGTLAPIVADRHHARIPVPTRRLLRKLSGRYPWIVVSGRSRDDVTRRLAGTGVTLVYGNHGLESAHASAAAPSQVLRWRRALAPRLADLAGVVLENKARSLAVHYRQSRDRTAARAAIIEAAGRLPGARLVGGKQVVNILPDRGGHKGTAILQARSWAGCDTALYVGDDDTDEDVFTLDQPGRLLSIRVGHHRESGAAYYLRRRADIDALLRALITVRTP
jgi:trehalose 6-phosphate phosphatase